MNSGEKFEVKIISSPELIDDVKNDYNNYKDDIEIVSFGRESDPTLLRLNIGDAANLVTIVQGVFFLGPFCLTLFKSIKRHRKNTIVQTNFDRSEILYNEALTEEEVRARLKRLTEEKR